MEQISSVKTVVALFMEAPFLLIPLLKPVEIWLIGSLRLLLQSQKPQHDSGGRRVLQNLTSELRLYNSPDAHPARFAATDTLCCKMPYHLCRVN
jgi:hypothetical protein